jgi:hypothetical protein
VRRSRCALPEPVCRARFARAVGALVVALCFAHGARAELVRVEAIGSVPLGAASRGGAAARQDALEAGIREAVERTALDLAKQAGSAADAETVRAAIGSDPKALAARYKILEDRGERAPLLESSPAAEREYVVAVEVEVDRGALRTRLTQAGLLAGTSAAAAPGGARRVVLEGVDSYPLWIRIRDSLGARGGAVRPLEFAPGRIVAELGAAEPSGSVVSRLAAGLGEAFDVQPLGEDGDGIHIGVTRRPAPEESAAPPTAAAPAEPVQVAPAR